MYTLLGELASNQDPSDPSSFNWVKQMYASCLDEGNWLLISQPLIHS